MVDILRPDYGQAWSSEGEKVAPAADKVALGWVQEMMPFQWENFLQARQDEALLYLLQKGVPEYSPTQEYSANKSVVQYQGNLYIATTTVTGVLPTTTTSWRKLSATVGVNGAVSVAGGGTGATTASSARENLGLGDAATATLPTASGVVVKGAGNVLLSRLLTGTSGDIVVTNPDGATGNINVGVGSNVAKVNQDSSWVTTGGLGLPKGSSGDRLPQVGRVRFNTELGHFEGYDGVKWQYFGSSGATLAVQEISSDGASLNYPLLTIPTHKNNIIVMINGVYQNKSTYSINTTSIVFTEAPSSGFIEVIPMTAAPFGASVTWEPPTIDESTLNSSVTGILAVLRVAGFIQ